MPFGPLFLLPCKHLSIFWVDNPAPNLPEAHVLLPGRHVRNEGTDFFFLTPLHGLAHFCLSAYLSHWCLKSGSELSGFQVLGMIFQWWHHLCSKKWSENAFILGFVHLWLEI